MKKKFLVSIAVLLCTAGTATASTVSSVDVQFVNQGVDWNITTPESAAEFVESQLTPDSLYCLENVITPHKVGHEFHHDHHHDNSPSPVPLPAAAWLFGSGLMGVLGFIRPKV